MFITFILHIAEDQLRAKGYDKTPDFILEVPIGEFLAFVVNSLYWNATVLDGITGWS